MEQNKTNHPLALSRVEPSSNVLIQDESLIFQDALDAVKN